MRVGQAGLGGHRLKIEPGCWTRRSAPSGSTGTPRAPRSVRTPAPPTDPGGPLTFVFVVPPAAFAAWNVTQSGPGAGSSGLLSAEVVNRRHGVDPLQSVLVEVRGWPAALQSLAARLCVDDDRQRRDLRARIAAATAASDPARWAGPARGGERVLLPG